MPIVELLLPEEAVNSPHFESLGMSLAKKQELQLLRSIAKGSRANVRRKRTVERCSMMKAKLCVFESKIMEAWVR